MAQQSNIGNQTTTALPAYLLRQKDGIFVDLTLFPVGGGFELFIDKLFSEGTRFQGLDYRLLMDLLYDYDAILDANGIGAKLKLASDVVVFSPKRKALYKGVKVDSQGKRAEYFFEPVQIEVVVEEPVYGEPGADGVAPIVGSTRKEELKPTQLDMDEFIADMWLKGVRFGIDVEKVAGVIARAEMGRMTVAVQLDATEGSDAEIEEASEVLRRDNSPKILPNGKADLRKFQNRFPQIELDARLLKKKPRVLGKPGFTVNGGIIEPETPKDLDLQPLAGPGTRVEKQDGFEFIVSSRHGFLSLDVDSNNISVTEKIENKSGINMKTTGDLSLSGNEFIEHGEVQEGRAVEGKNMTFRSDVYGDVVSQGGFILLESNLSGGSAKSLGGDVTANGRTFNSVIEAWGGRVSVKYAESCLIKGETVVIERAVNCEIIAKNVQIDKAEGCGIAGVVVKIKSSNSCRGKQNIVAMVVPSISIFDAQIAQVDKAIDDCQKIVAVKELALAEIKADADFAKYLALATNIKLGTVKLTLAHQENWQKMVSKFARPYGMVEKLNAEKQEQLDRMLAFQQEKTYLLAAREKSGIGVCCEISEVVGDTLVRTMVAQNEISEFHNTKISELRILLREQGLQSERIFTNDEGSLDWTYAPPEIVESP
jgi:hypothetical protein